MQEQSRKRRHSPDLQEQQLIKKMHDVQSLKRMHSPDPQEQQPMKGMHVYNAPTPGGMAIRRANVRQVLSQIVSHDQLEQAFNTYKRMHPIDRFITQEEFDGIATAYHGGKMRHKKHVHSYKKRSMNKKRAKSMKKK